MNLPRIALIAHDSRKRDMLEFVHRQISFLRKAWLVATDGTGTQIMQTHPDLSIQLFKSGPYGGDQQLGALVCQGQLDALIFFIDPLTAHAHNADVLALLRLAILYDVPIACGMTGAEMMCMGIRQRGRAACPESTQPQSLCME